MNMITRRSFLIAILLFVVAACSKKAAVGKPDDVAYYTCAMHPSVKSQDPDGKCPICSMDLVPVMKKATDSNAAGNMGAIAGMNMGEENASGRPAPGEKPSEFVVPVERQQQIGVTYATVATKALHHTVRAVGLVQSDASREWQFVARVDGYVQKLYVTSPGEIVKKNEPLMSIYSPDLLTSERELVQLRRGESGSSGAPLIEAAERRLKQWNVTDEQIASLERSGTPTENLTLLSPFTGVVQMVSAGQGKNVKVGDALADVADLSVVWVWAEIYEDEMSMVKKGQKAVVFARAYPNEGFYGEIALVNPFVDEMKRTSKVRIDIPNPDFKLRPGMYANVELAMDMGQGLAIPVSAVMPTGLRNVVFVDKGMGKLEPRIVQLGGEFGDYYEVKEGVAEGERVVASANFLIDAESKVQGALKDFEEPPMAKLKEKQ